MLPQITQQKLVPVELTRQQSRPPKTSSLQIARPSLKNTPKMWQVVNSLESKQLGNTEVRHFEGMPHRCNSNRPTVCQDVWQAQRCCLRVVRFTLEKTSLTLSKIKIKSMITLSSSSFRRDKSTCYTDKALKPARDPRGANGSLGCTHLQ